MASARVSYHVFFLKKRLPPRSTLFPYPTLFRSTIRKAANDFVQQNKWHWPLAPPFFLAADAKHIAATHARSEEHTSEFQSRLHFVCRLLLEKKTHIL